MHESQSAAGLTQTLPTLKPVKPEQSWEENDPENISITHLKVPLSTILTVLWFEFPFDVSLYRQLFASESWSGLTFNPDLLEKNEHELSKLSSMSLFRWMINLVNRMQCNLFLLISFPPITLNSTSEL